jgi:hypothetical protein
VLAAVGVPWKRRWSLVAWSVTLALLVAIPLYTGGGLLRAAGSLPFLDVGLFARSKILIVLAIAVLVACGVEALEDLAAAGSLRRLALDVAPFAITVPFAFLLLDFHSISRPSDAVFRVTPGIAKLQENLRVSAGRFAAAGWTMPPNVAEALELEDARGHFLHEAAYRTLVSAADPNAYGRFGTYLVFHPRSLDPSSPVLDLLNVTVLAAPPGSAAPVGSDAEHRDAATMGPIDPGTERPAPDPGRFPRIYSGPDLTLFARPTAFPRFRLVSQARAGGVDEVRRADRATLAASVFVPPDVERRLAAGAGRGAEGKIRILALEPERFEIETETALPSLLVSSQKSFPPYWRLSLDGAPAAGFLANGIFLGMELPAGRHRVEGDFRIPGLELLISIAGLAALTLVMGKAIR